ncbi:MAG: DUF4062 domain-containing protein, partial [Promethearchaeota archaeon]
MKRERNILQKNVFPKLRELCMAHGMHFQAIDLRWGISQEAALDQKSVKICLREILRCQNISPKPNFIVLLGDRYGWQPPPSDIPIEEFIGILKHLLGDDDEKNHKRDLLERWYECDDNADPTNFFLKPRGEKYKNAENWEPIEKENLNILRESVDQMDLEEKNRIKYFASVTEQEIRKGALEIEESKEHIFCFFRSIEGLPNDETAKDFIDLNQEKRRDKDSAKQLEKLKD